MRRIGRSLSTAERLAVAIVISSVVVWLLDLAGGWPMVYALGVYPDAYMLQQRPWGVVTYMWVHSDLMHLLINTLTLVGVGGLFHRYGTKRLLGLCALGALVGAMTYLLGYHLLQALGMAIAPLPLLGSSAAVYALAFGIACVEPHRRVHFWVGEVRFVLLVVAWMAIDWLFVGGNWGGRLAHLGGALSGILWGIRYRAGKGDIQSWLCWLRCLVGRQSSKRHGEATQDVKKILDKLRHSGLSGISDEERKVLHRASEQLQRQE